MSGRDDLDFALALSLQEQFERERREEKEEEAERGRRKDVGDSEGLSRWDPRLIVDDRWELLDPHPNIHDLFVAFDGMFFERRLVEAGVEVRWSPRMTLCAGVCSYEGRGGLCSVRLSVPLLKLRPRRDLVETLLHEMIHALLFVTERNTDHDGHGPNFCSHMRRINSLTGTNITIYHTFHQEVRLYRQHWWRCSGPCRNRPPFYGWVKRAMNRAPSPRDRWWADHQLTCGGSYTKVKEPENYGKKKKAGELRNIKVEKDTRRKSKAASSRDIKEMMKGNKIKESGKEARGSDGVTADKIFSGQGHTLSQVTLPQAHSQTERRQALLEAAERRQTLAQSKGMKRKSSEMLSHDIRRFCQSLPAGEKRARVGPSSAPQVATTSSNYSASFGRDIPSQQGSESGSSASSVWPEPVAIEPDNDDDRECVVLGDSDDCGDGGDGSEGVHVGMCPVCGQVDIPSDVINAHVTQCLDEEEQQDTVSSNTAIII